MIVISWTALFHAIFYKKGVKPWYKARNGRFIRVDGEPKHWELSECLKKYYGNSEPASKKNMEFLIGLRNKIEHRYLPELDPSLYGECQAALLNLEEILVDSFGETYALTEQLAVSLQFSSVVPSEKRKAARILASKNAKTVTEYVETFRGGLPSTTLNSMKYSFNVFLVPKVANREKIADVAVQFIKVDEASPEELERLERLNVLIKEKRIPIANLDLFRPSQVMDKVNESSTYKMTLNSHANTWKHFGVRPVRNSDAPQECQTEYCVYDEAHGDYLFTQAWVRKCTAIFNSREQFLEIIGREPIEN